MVRTTFSNRSLSTTTGSMCASGLLNLLWLLPVTLLDIISARDSAMSPLCQALPSHSHSTPVMPSFGAGAGHGSSPPVVNCSDPGRLVAVKVQLHSNRHTARGNQRCRTYCTFRSCVCLLACLSVCSFVCVPRLYVCIGIVIFSCVEYFLF